MDHLDEHMDEFAKDFGNNIENVSKMKALCTKIVEDPRSIDNLRDLQVLVKDTSPNLVRVVQTIILPVYYPILKNLVTNDSDYKFSEKQVIVDSLKVVLDRIIVDNLSLFFNIYGFLLYQVYDGKNHAVYSIPEEYKLSLVECTISLMKSLSCSIVTELYVKENSPKLCQMIFVLLEMANKEQLKTLRISCINCIMAVAKVLYDDDFIDLVVRDQIAEVYLFFLPGVASKLRTIALCDEKVGHKIPTVALKAWGRIVTLMMQDYNASDNQLSLIEILEGARSKTDPATESNFNNNKKWKDEGEMNEYLEKMKRSPEWYRTSDRKLQKFIISFSKLTYHSHSAVRIELAEMAHLIITNCIQNMPQSIAHLVEIVITLSGDSEDSVSLKSKQILHELSEKFSRGEFKALLESLEDGFYNAIMSLPRKFNGIDESEQLSALNLLIGYISLFEKHNLTKVLYSNVHLNQLIETLIHISEFDRSDVSTLEEYTTQDLELTSLQTTTPWKKFQHFRETSIRIKLEYLCNLLAKFGASQIVSHILLDKFIEEPVIRKEVTFLLNEIATGVEPNDENINIFHNILSSYLDVNYWYPQLSVRIDEEGLEHTLGDVQSNIIQVCLLVEGVGKIANKMGKKFDKIFMLKTFYLILERAGSGHPFIRAAGTTSLLNIAKACGYLDISELITKNIDYFSFHVARKLHKTNIDKGVLNVVAVVMKYSTIEVLTLTSDMIQELLIQCCDKRRDANVNAYLHIFKMFVQCVHKWLNISCKCEPFKTKKQKEEDFENFKVSGIEEGMDFSDEAMGKSAEEMFEEDMTKKQKDLENEMYDHSQEYIKPEAPIHIKLTVTLLSKILHFLPSKDRNRKLLVMEILKDGLEIIKDYENDLLPMVHQIWSPLVARFKEHDDALVISLSFQLLLTLARLSKDFIRTRTAKEVLPSLLAVMDKLANESYLKDTRAAYRYTQKYKLQLTVLENIAIIVMNLDFLEEHIFSVMETVSIYLSDKQPLPLQSASLNFFKIMLEYDPDIVNKKVQELSEKFGPEYSKNFNDIIPSSL